MRFTLTAGQKGDAPQAAALLEGLPAEVVMADTAYDADHLREAIAAKGALAVIPNNPSRALKHPLDKHLYAQRHLVECCFSKLKQFRRVATRFEKTARNYLAVVTLAAIILWMRYSLAPSRASQRGAYRDRHGRWARDAVAEVCAEDERAIFGRRSRVVLTPRCWRQVGDNAGALRRRWWLTSPAHQGDHEVSRNTIRAGKAGLIRSNLW